MRFIIFITFITLLGGCGYRPSAKYAREVLGTHVSSDVIISSQDPENTVVIKDALDRALVEVFHSSLTTQKRADTHLIIALDTPKYRPIQYNSDGFVIAYRATITLRITRESKNFKKHYTTHGTYDFSVSPNAVLSDQERFDAIRLGASKAISAFMAQVSAEGYDKGE